MPENNKTEDFLQKLAPCIGRSDLDACVEEAARLAREMGVGAGELVNLSVDEIDARKYDFAYVLSFAAVQDLKGENKAVAFSNVGLAAQSIGKLGEAEEFYKKAIEIDPNIAEAYYNYANLFEKLGRKTEAEEHYKKAIEIDPKYAWAHHNYAALLVELGRKTKAEEHYKKAIEFDPEDTLAYYNYASFLAELGNNIESENHYKKLFELDPKNANAHNDYANLLKREMRFYDAEKEVRVALQIEPTNPYAIGTFGDIFTDEDYFKEAIEEYQKALEIVIKNPTSIKPLSISEIHNNLGWVYAQLKQHNKAKEEFKKALILDSMNVKAIRNLRKLGKIEVVPEISIIQICLGILLLLPLIESYYLFWISKLSETMFVAQSTILIALLIVIILYNQLAKVKIGSIEFEKSSEHRFIEAKSQPSEFER